MSAEVRGRINVLRETSTLLSTLAKKPLPDNISPRMVDECKQYDEWLNRAAKEMLSLATKGESELRNATKNMQEASNNFSLEYLALQQDMQNQNRQFTLVSNIMKIKHDTAKAAINNLR